MGWQKCSGIRRSYLGNHITEKTRGTELIYFAFTEHKAE